MIQLKNQTLRGEMLMYSLITAFLADVELRLGSPHTIAFYHSYLMHWVDFCEDDGSKQKLAEFLTSRYANPRTRATAWRAIRPYERWKHAQGLIPTDWTREVRIQNPPRPQYSLITPDELKRILAVIPDTLHGLRDRTYFMVVYYTLQRRSAIQRLRVEDVDLASRIIRIRTKRRVERDLPLALPAWSALAEWLPRLTGPWVFPSIHRNDITQYDRPVCAQHLTHMLPRYAKKAGITKRVWVHGLRHASATALGEVASGIDVVQHALGVTSASTAMIYMQTSQNKLQRELARAFG